MKKEIVRVDLFSDGERLYVHMPDGKNLNVNVYNGGGYYTVISLQTDAGIAAQDERINQSYREEDARISARLEEKAARPWYKKMFD